jgi:hypothetical protein
MMTASRRVFLGQICEQAQLRRLKHSGGNFYSEHLKARLPLSVGAMLQTKWAELFRGDRSALQLLNALCKPAYFRFNGFATMPFFDVG